MTSYMVYEGLSGVEESEWEKREGIPTLYDSSNVVCIIFCQLPLLLLNAAMASVFNRYSKLHSLQVCVCVCK